MSSGEYRHGEAVEVLDGESSWSAKVLEVSGDSALVHFLKFNARHDEWIPLGRLRRRKEESFLMSSVGSMESKEFNVGDRVMAPWKYGRKYPGVVLLREVKSGGYKVKFDDGVTVSVKPSTMRYLRKDEEEEEGEEEEEEEEDDIGEGSESPSSVDQQLSSHSRRERKSKFNIKELLTTRRPRRRSKVEEEGVEEESPSETSDTSSPSLDSQSLKSNSKASAFHSSKKPSSHSSNTSKDNKKRKASEQRRLSPEAGSSTKRKTKATPTAAAAPSPHPPPHRKECAKSASLKKESHAKGGGAAASKRSDSSKNTSAKSSSHSIGSVSKDEEDKRDDTSASEEPSVSVNNNNNNNINKKSDKNGGYVSSSDPSKEENDTSSSSSSSSMAPLKNTSDSKKAATKVNGSLKPRITEPLLKEGPPIALVTGKRERKRKKFWDEEEESSSSPIAAPPAKSSKRSSSDVSSRRSSSSHSGITESCVKPPTTVGKPSTLGGGGSTTTSSGGSIKPFKGKLKTEAEVMMKGNNGKKLEYLLFDMSLEPKLIARQMVEGLNIPGPGEPIPVDSSSLPLGWEKRVVQRGLGVTRGKWDVFIQNAAGKSFRSKTELQKHFDENNLNFSIDSFDFSLDDNLKRLRQIWKQFVIKPKLKPGEKLSSPVPAKYSRKGNKQQHLKEAATGSEPSSSLHQANNHPSGGGGYLPRVNSSHPKEDIARVPSPTSPSLGEVRGGSSSSSPGIISETGQGLRCKINHCGKLFRNDKLLLMHVKHYHPEFRDVIPPVSCVPHTGGEEEQESGFGKRKGGDSSSTASHVTLAAPPEKKLKTLLPEVVVDKRKALPPSNSESVICPPPLASSGRKRNDSSLSVGSGYTTDGERTASPPIPSLKSSHQRKLQPSSAGGGKNSKKYSGFSVISQVLQEEDSNSEIDAASADHLTSEEVVNCTCRRLEEDGLMIQCDVCLCWQHGACLGIFDEDQVPDKHVCSVCKNPPGCRHLASRTHVDQDLLKEGKMGCILGGDSSSDSTSASSDKLNAFRKLSDLMSDLMGLNKVLHSLRVKIAVASQRSSSKVFMWSSPWVSPHQPPQKEEEKSLPLVAHAPPVKDDLKVREPLESNSTPPHPPPSISNDLNGFKEADIDPSMIPSVSEVQELLPSIIEAEGLLSSAADVEDFTPQPPLPTIIPEPKRIDKEESRTNLIQHIDDVQVEIEERLNVLEENLVRLESEDKYSELTIDDAVNADCAKTKAIIQMLLLDLSTGKTMLGSML